jgi:hypothetical protein
MSRLILALLRRRYVFAPAPGAHVLIETGDTLLLETGDKLLVD